MTRDFFIRLTFALHRVAGVIPDQVFAKEFINASNRLLSDFVLATDPGIAKERKRTTILPGALREVIGLRAYFSYARRLQWLNPQNFLLLEREYFKVEEAFKNLYCEIEEEVKSTHLYKIAEEEPVPFFMPTPSRVEGPVLRVEQKQELVGQTLQELNKSRQEPVEQMVAEQKESNLSSRQQRILGILKGKEKTQVWELQKLFPEVTKRTLRRDLDDLLQKNLVQRGGEWNSVFYQVR